MNFNVTKIKLIAAFTTLGVAVSLFYWRHQRQEKIQFSNSQHKHFVQHEIEILKSSEESSQRKALAIKRISMVDNSLLMGGFSELLNSQDETLREAMISAFFLQPPEKIKISKVKNFMGDPSRKVRNSVFLMLSQKKVKDSILPLRKQLSRNNLPAEEAIKIWGALYFQEEDEAEKDKSFNEIYKYSQSQYPEDRWQAVSMLRVLSPDHPKLTQLLRDSLYQAKDETLIPLALLMLSRNADPWLSENIKSFLFHSNWNIRNSSLSSLIEICPDNTLELLNQFIAQEKDSVLIEKAKDTAEHLSKKPCH